MMTVIILRIWHVQSILLLLLFCLNNVTTWYYMHSLTYHMYIMVIQNNCPGIMAHNCMTAGIVQIKIWGRVARFDEVVQNEQIVPEFLYYMS